MMSSDIARHCEMKYPRNVSWSATGPSTSGSTPILSSQQINNFICQLRSSSGTMNNGTVVNMEMIVANYVSHCPGIRNRVNTLDDTFSQDLSLKYVVISAYILIAAVGVIGNAMVVAAVARVAHMRTVRNYFIVLLAISDLFMSTITLPFYARTMLKAYWDLGEFLCKAVSSIQTINVFVSTMSMAAISADRYVVIVFPTKFKAQKFVILSCSTLICATAVIMTIPVFLTVEMKSPFGPRQRILVEQVCEVEVRICIESPHPIWSPMYTVFCLLFQYLIPLLSLIFLNHRITRRLNRRPTSTLKKRHTYTSQAISADVAPMRAMSQCEPLNQEVKIPPPRGRFGSRSKASISLLRPGNFSTSVRNKFQSNLSTRSNSEGSGKEPVSRHVRIKRIMFSVVLTFALAWLPFNIYNLLIGFSRIKYDIKIYCFCHIIAMSGVCANPIIYGAFNENFRNEFQRIAKQLSPQCQSTDADKPKPVHPADQWSPTVIPLNGNHIKIKFVDVPSTDAGCVEVSEAQTNTEAAVSHDNANCKDDENENAVYSMDGDCLL